MMGGQPKGSIFPSQEPGKDSSKIEEQIAWAKQALESLKRLRKRVHETHTTYAASGELGKCYVCGDGENELIKLGEKLFP